MKPLIVGLGNEFLGDDGIGIAAARRLREDDAVCAEIVDCNLSGVALLDVLAGYSKVIFIDAIKTKKFAPGTIVELDVDSLRSIPSDSPHHTGLPELVMLSRRLGIDFPDEIVIIAVEVDDCFSLGASLSEAVKDSLEPLADKVRSRLEQWKSSEAIN